MMKTRHILLLFIAAVLFSNGCDRSARSAASEELTAHFILDKRSYETGETVTFLNKSTGFSSVRWNLGDGTTSTADSPKHIYKAPGDYFPELTVTRSTANETFRMKITITGQPIAEAAISQQGEEASGNEGSSEDTERAEAAGAGSAPENAADAAADDLAGELAEETEEVRTYAIIPDKQVAATGTRISFGTGTSDTVNWSLDENNLQTGITGSAVYKTPGMKTVFISLPGRKDTLAKTTVQIYRTGAIPPKVKAGDRLVLTAEGDLPLKWEIDDGRSFNQKRTSVSFDAAGTYTISLVNENDNTTLSDSKITVEKTVVIPPEEIAALLNMLANAGKSMGEKDQVAKDLRSYCVNGGNTKVGGKATGNLDDFIIKLRMEATRYVKVNIQCDLEYGKNQMVSKIIITGITSTNV